MAAAVPRRFTRAIRTGTQHGSGMAARLSGADLHKPYVYQPHRGTMTGAEVKARLAGVRARLAAKGGA